MSVTRTICCLYAPGDSPSDRRRLPRPVGVYSRHVSEFPSYVSTDRRLPSYSDTPSSVAPTRLLTHSVVSGRDGTKVRYRDSPTPGREG